MDDRYCKKSKSIDRLVVSTDDAEISEIAKKLGAEVPFISQQKFQKMKHQE